MHRVCGCSGQGTGGSRRHSERFSLPLPAHFKDAELLSRGLQCRRSLCPPFARGHRAALPGERCLGSGRCARVSPPGAPASPSQPCSCPGGLLGDHGGPAPCRASVRNQGREVRGDPELLFSSLGHPLPFLRTRKGWGIRRRGDWNRFHSCQQC